MFQEKRTTMPPAKYLQFCSVFDVLAYHAHTIIKLPIIVEHGWLIPLKTWICLFIYTLKYIDLCYYIIISLTNWMLSLDIVPLFILGQCCITVLSYASLVVWSFGTKTWAYPTLQLISASWWHDFKSCGNQMRLISLDKCGEVRHLRPEIGKATKHSF